MLYYAKQYKKTSNKYFSRGTDMTVITQPKSKLIQELKGIHQFGFDGAPCSQRVSFALAEKGLIRNKKVHFMADSPEDLIAPEGQYILRNVSLPKRDHLSDDYAKIHPNLVVPALVHNGQLHIELMEIVEYLDKTWPDSPLIPTEPDRKQLCDDLVALGKQLHVSVRYTSFHWGLGSLAKMDAKTQAKVKKLENEDSPEHLYEFHSRFSQNKIEDQTFIEHLRALERGYSDQEARLKADNRLYLTGNTFSIADIIWSIKVQRLVECGYPFKKNYPHLSDWYKRVTQREGFKTGVAKNNRGMHYLFRFKAFLTNTFGNSIHDAALKTT
jgi:glutathione S-transferase